jgi:hypothetical protein
MNIDEIRNSINNLDKPMHEKTPYYLRAIMEILFIIAENTQKDSSWKKSQK